MQTQIARSFTNLIPLEPRQKTGGCAAQTSPQIAPPPTCEVPPDVVHLAIMLTRRCNMSCAHCSVESSPKIKGEPSAAELLEAVRAAHKSGVQSILFTGGEPMLREEVLVELLRECQSLGLSTALASNGFWGKTPERARQTVARLKEAGLQLTTISYDRYHADYQGPQPAVNIARAVGEAKLTINISVTRTAQETDLDAIVAPFAEVPNANLRFYDVQPIGRARDFEPGTLRGELGGFCNACTAPALTDDGRLTACNGPSYFSDAASPLAIGNVADEPLDVLLHRHREDAILEAVRTHGPQWILGELQTLPGFENWARPSYGGMCDLCLHLNSDEAAVTALRAHLDDPRLQAERMARRQVIVAARREELSCGAVNSAGAARVWWNAAFDATTLDAPAANVILGRADLNWSEQLLYLSQCGFAGPLLDALDNASLKRWAPQFFRDKLREQATIDAMRSLLHQDVMREIAAVARAENTTGILLKGGALLALDDETCGDLPARSSCDLDIYFPPTVAARVHARLIEAGFKAESEELNVEDELNVEAAQRHQLPGLSRSGVSIEIHQTLLPAFCGAPQSAMLRGTRALQAPELRGLRVPKPEAMLLHTLLHCSKHLWTHGLKAAHDVAWICERFPDLNWNWLARLVARTGMKRGFWAPLTLLHRELQLPVPASFMARAPRDRRQQKLERIARRHLFNATRADFQDNPWICHPLYLLQSDSWLHRARHVQSLTFGNYERQMRAQRLNQNAEHRRTRVEKLGRAMRAWRDL